MAILANFDKLSLVLKHQANLQHVISYLAQSLDELSEVYKRILEYQEPSFSKVDLGHGCFALEQVFYTKERSECFFESHKKYIDFQLMIYGSEQMELVDVSHLQFENYDQSKDFIYYGDTNVASRIVLRNHDLAIFFPDDAHMGMPLFEQKELVYKTVVKVPVELWDWGTMNSGQ